MMTADNLSDGHDLVSEDFQEVLSVPEPATVYEM
ncbi:hypothetical protein N826_06105 [Skermanella aerolata KACC 11604]|nr:hypothetical protein N826_06105 [Skermanella aerolata KACC 11604]